jgi:hypothetical protein
VQFHWTNRADAPYADFAGFLASLQRDKRKKIQQEQRRVAAAGIAFSAATGDAIDAADWDFFYRCYTLTYRAHHSTPYLTRDFFARTAATMGENWLLFVARRGERPIATSLIAIDPSARPRSAATGARSSTSAACTSTPATTSRSPGASPTAMRASKAARKASTRWRAASAGADVVGALAGASAVRARGRRLPRPRRRRASRATSTS